MAMKWLWYLCFFWLLPVTALAQNDPFNIWIQQTIQEAIDSGINPATAYNTLSSVVFDDRVIELDQKQPETIITFSKYSRNILKPDRIQKGRQLLAQHKTTLNDIGLRYGVSPSVIVALWSIESNYGRNTGSFDVIESLATLAYGGRRSEFFKNELFEALRILDEERLDPSQMNGSWAGAMGQSQFMPSTYRRHAVDYDGDGRRDIWENEADVFASIANYLVAEGWQRNFSWGREVRIRSHNNLTKVEGGLNVQHSLAEWNRFGVTTLNGKPLPEKPLQASLIWPDGPGGRIFMVYDNFRALMRWNRSTYFATTVGLLADKINVSR